MSVKTKGLRRGKSATTDAHRCTRMERAGAGEGEAGDYSKCEVLTRSRVAEVYAVVKYYLSIRNNFHSSNTVGEGGGLD